MNTKGKSGEGDQLWQQLVQNRKLGSKGTEITINGTIFDEINIEVMEVDHFKEIYLVLSTEMKRCHLVTVS